MPHTIENLFLANRGRVYRWAHAMTRRHAEALDALQEVFLRLIRSQPLFDDDRSAAAWLRRATSSVVIDQWRSRRSADAAMRQRPGRQTIDMPANTVEDADTADCIRAAIARLSQQQQLVFLAKVCDDDTFQAIADELGIAVPTAKTHYVRALAAIRDALGESNGPGDAATDRIIPMPNRGERHDVPRVSIQPGR